MVIIIGWKSRRDLFCVLRDVILVRAIKIKYFKEKEHIAACRRDKKWQWEL